MSDKFYDEKTKLWGCLEPIEGSNKKIAVGQIILDLIFSYGSKVAQINHDNGANLSFREIWANTICVTQNLQKRGFLPGQVFTFLVHRPDHLVSIVLASICLGCPINPLHPMLSQDELVRVLKKTEPAVIFANIDYHSRIDEVLKILGIKTKIFTFDGRTDGSEPVENLFKETNVVGTYSSFRVDIESDIGAILCSSGSTGPSKCVSLSYSTLIPSADESRVIGDGDIGLCFDSIFWAVGLRFMIRCAQYGATNIITKKSFSPDLQLNLVEKYKVSVLCGIPLNLLQCLKNHRIHEVDLSSLKTIIFYGSKAPKCFIEQFQRHFPNVKVLTRYGTAEIGHICDRFLDAEKCENVGRLVSGCVAKIINDQGERCGPNIRGEICVKKSEQFLGYYKDKETTEAALDNEGFLMTGDIGHFDNNGNLLFDDRKKFLINGFYFEGVVLPTEIEAHLLSISDIEEACVVGIPIIDNYEIPAAIVVCKKDSELTQQSVYDIIADKCLEPEKLRGGIYFVDSLFKTHNGKLDRIQIRKQAAYLFYKAQNSDPDIQTLLNDFPEDYRKLVKMFVPDSLQ